MSWMWQRLWSGKLWFLRDSCRQRLLAALSSELAWSRSDSPQPENAYGESERLGLLGGKNSSRTGDHFNGLVQDCSIPIANALEILQYCPKKSLCTVSTVPRSMMLSSGNLTCWTTLHYRSCTCWPPSSDDFASSRAFPRLWRTRLFLPIMFWKEKRTIKG